MSPHRTTLVSLVKKHGWTKGVELGVDKGILFRLLLEGVPALHLTGVDLFPDRTRSRRAFETAATHADRCTLLTMSTDEAALLVPDGSLDFVFIDADHSYEAVKQDIAHWLPKVKAGGWIGGHDYHPRRWPGVVAAVREAFPAVDFYPGTIWGVAR